LAKTVAAESAVPILVLSAFATGLASLALRRSQRRFNREVSHHLTHLERLKTREVP
jgi:CHASE1-domain containing sensor protein